MTVRSSRRRTAVGDRGIIRSLPKWPLLAIGFLLLTAAMASADVPTRYEQFIYSVVAFTGRDYSGTFVRQPSPTLYLLANRDSFLEARSTFVYFWAITGNYRLDTTALNHQFDGSLKITGNGISRKLTMEPFTYYDLHGKYDLSWKAAKGPEARRIYQHYQDLASGYQQKSLAYHSAQNTYQQHFTALVKKIIRLRTDGEDTSALVARLRSMKAPTPPTPPSEYVSPPVTPENAFVVNLPAGHYKIEFINPDGTVMQGSQKRLIVFAPRGRRLTGYDVIPADKWTRSVTSKLSGSVLYVNGSSDLYLRPFYEAQYNELFHKKLVNNDARANATMSEWVKLQQVPNAKVTLQANGSKQVVTQHPFGVQQLQGSSLGYKIVPWAQFQHQPGAKPDLIAYHVPISPNDRVVRIGTELPGGAASLAGSFRQIRVVSGSTSSSLLIIFIVLPFVAAGVVIGIRSRRYAK